MIHAINFKAQFADKILSGEKKQTIRLPRKREIKVGDELHLYTGLRTKKCKLLKKVVCKKIINIEIQKTGIGYKTSDMDNAELSVLDFLNAFAIADGFKNTKDFFKFFADNYSLPQDFILIKW